MDEDTAEEATQTPQESPKAVPKEAPAKKAKHKAHHAAKHASAKAAIPPPKAPKAQREKSNAALLIVYIILGVLVIATSFYTGYLLGKSTGGSAGTQTGKLQIIEYSDYQCPYCGMVEPTVDQIKQTYGDKIDFQYKNFPLTSLHPYAMGAAIAAECAREQGTSQFWTYHDTLFKHQDALDIASLKQYAQAQGLDMSKFNDCLDNNRSMPQIQADIQEATARGVQGTPSFWIKDELFVGAQPFANFKAKIDEKLSGNETAPAPQPTQQQQPTQPTGPVNVAEGTHVQGSANATVAVIEFSDYQCPYCQRYFQQDEPSLYTDYIKTGKVRFSFRNFPLSFHQNAQIAAEAAECAGAQGKYWEMHDILYTKGSGDGTGLDEASLKQYAQNLSLDMTKFNSCLDNHEMAAVVQKDEQDGTTAGVQGTPTTFVNGVAVVGAVPYSDLKAAINAALAK